jgi:hypothetical protein
LGQVVALQPPHTPPTQSPAPHTEQPRPPVPHASAVVPGMQVAPAQQPLAQEVVLQPAGSSRWQVAEQPSPLTVLRSSHCSMGARIVPSPQIAGGPSVIVAGVSAPVTSDSES